MDNELEKIDLVRDRMKVTYSEAKEALDRNGGNVVDAIVYLEKNQKSFAGSVGSAGNEFVEGIKNIVKKGNVNRVRIRKDDKVILDIPVNAGVVGGAIGVIYLPALMAIGAVAAVVSKIDVEIVRPNGDVEVVNDLTAKTGDDAGGTDGDEKSGGEHE